MSEKTWMCLQIHNDYQIVGGETKTAIGIGDLLEQYGVKVIRYYKSNKEFEHANLIQKIKIGMRSIFNLQTEKDIKGILRENQVDFALIHNTSPLISNTIYSVLEKHKIPIIKYVQNYNLICLNGALDCGEKCQQCKKNCFIGVHNKCYKQSKPYSFIKFVVKMDMDKHHIRKIDAFMPNSGFVANKLIDYGIPANRMHVMYNYIDIKETTDIMQQGDYYLYFGRLSKEKGILTVIAAFKKLKNSKLIIMGEGDQKETIIEMIRNTENIEYIGAKYGLDLEQVVRRAKYVIVSSEWEEPLPRTIIESYQQGTPVIGTEMGGIPEMIKIGKTGFVYRSGNENALVEVIRKTEQLSQSQYNDMRVACRRELCDVYSKEEYYKRFMMCVREICRRGE